MLIRSGIAPLDSRLAGIAPGRIYVLSGGPGTGKSLACLEFLNAGLEQGETAALLTHEDPQDVLSQGEFLGLDIDQAFENQRLIQLRYQLDFTRQLSRAAEPDVVFEELRRLLGGSEPKRIAIDSIAPILDGGTAAAGALVSLLRFLETSGATALLTYPGDLEATYDRRLESLVQRAGALLHLTRPREGTAYLEIRKSRFGTAPAAAVAFVIRPGSGLTTLDDGAKRRASDVSGKSQRTLLVLSDGETIAPEMLDALRTRFELIARPTSEAVAGGGRRFHAGAILIGVRRDSMVATLDLVRALRAAETTAPIALLTCFSLRAGDRTRALRAGADDFYGTELRPDELVLRVDRLVRNGRSASVSHEDDGAKDTLPETDSVLEENAFRDAVRSRMASSAVPFFTVVRLAPEPRDEAALKTLAETARRQVRHGDGDVAGRLDGSVAIYLHSARRKDVIPFVSRMRDAWREAGGNGLEVRTIAYPGEDAALRELLEA